MGRIILKGGVWKNTEDEILKAAVMKYGKNQWSRISSLLNRKTPKQCKARWYEWLDPSIKKTDWSREEDEKLLHLAKLMPTQWRTIAPIVGRTPAQCLDRYQRLLDEAEQREEGGEVEAGPTADDVRRLRPGEIDPDPETKPAKPDPVDMDEDEKEMLSEARARLANTQGKKAKRKARERQLAEARRLAAVQKHRELKAAGIHWKPRLRRGEFDYNNEIPFQTEIPAGFYDVTEENEREIEKITRGTKEQFEGKTRAQAEMENRKKDATKKRQSDKHGLLPQKKPVIKTEEPFAKRRKLELPAPRLGDQELEEIVKISQSSEAVRAVIGASDLDGTVDGTATGALVGDYNADISQRFAAVRTAARAAQTPVITSIVETEAANLLALQKAQTPLLGGDISLREGGTGFEGKTPQRLLAAAAAATPARGSTPAISGGRTPAMVGGSTPYTAFGGRTPRRDGFGINNRVDEQRLGDDGEYEENNSTADLREVLDFGFSSLPKPKNEFEIILPAEETAAADDVDGDQMAVDQEMHAVEDKADVERRRLHAVSAEQRRLEERRSQAVRRNLPRPRAFPGQTQYDKIVQSTQLDDSVAEVDRMIADELWLLLQNDAVEYPVPGTTINPRTVPPKSELSDEELAQARQLATQEAKDCESNTVNDREEGRWSLKRDRSGRVFSVYNENKGADLESLKIEYDFLINLHSALTGRSAKLQDRLRILLGGYIARSKSLQQQVEEKMAEYQRLSVELRSFEQLAQHESTIAIPTRINRLQAEVQVVQSLEKTEQKRYLELKAATQQGNGHY